MRVLVIGGTRFIGPPLVRRLMARGHEVTVFHRGRTEADLPSSVNHLIGDRHHLVDRWGEFRDLAPEIVVDMIAFTEDDARGLVETFRGLARRTVVASSADVYRAYGRFLGIEEGPVEPTPLPEEAPLRTTLYPHRKPSHGPDDFFSSYEKVLVERSVLGEPDLPGTVLRLPMVHGPGDPFRRLSPYLKRMNDGRPAILLDETMARWKCPRGYVENVAAAIALAVTDERSSGRVYNVAEPVPDTEAEWVRKLGGLVGWKGKVVEVPGGRVPVSFNATQSLDTDSERIRRELGYVEPVSPDDGLRLTVEWERSQPETGVTGVGLLDSGDEDALLHELGRTGS